MDKYKQTEEILNKQGKFYISLELDRIKAILKLLDNPQNNLKVIHVAGTNGKGSTCAIINRILIENGYKTGLYTSPHLIKYNERIKVNNKPIDDDKFYKSVKEIDDLAEVNNIHLTEFEILTAVMYKYFYEEKVDYAVVEVGLGGRFDATNCIDKALICVITSISKDHTERLGNTIEKIAFEKGGIIKNNCPVVINKNNSGLKTLSAIAQEKSAQIYYPKPAKITYNGKNILAYDKDNYDFALLGKLQEENASLAICCAEILGLKDKTKIKNALKKVKWACRFEYIKDKNIILDGCHNPDGAKVLRESLDYYFPYSKRIFLYTSLKNKDFKAVQKNLFRNNDKIYNYAINDEKFIQKQDIDNCYKSLDIKGVELLIKNKNKEDLLIICGSLYALGDILGKINLCS